MIVGNGDVASVLPERDDLLFFASGVSNSAETRPEAFQREVDLLMERDKEAHIVYFGSLAVFYSDTPYAQHKRAMEVKVKQEFARQTIIRIGNSTWGTNPHTFINHIRGQIERGEEPTIWDVYRYVVDKDEFLYWIDLIPEWNCEMTIVGRRLKVAQIVAEIVAGKL